MSSIMITNENFEKEVMQSDKTVLIDFWAPWCAPCRMLSPVIEELSKEITDKKICKINVDEQPELAEKFQVMSIPTLIVIKNGTVTNRMSGAIPKQTIMALFN